MSVRADYDPKYFRRFLYIAFGSLAFSSWFLYDAVIGYPKKLERSEVYWTKAEEAGKKYVGLDRNEWKNIVSEKNWPTDIPEKPDEMRHKIEQQYFFAIVCGLVCIPCLIMWFRARGTWVEGDEDSLASSSGHSFKFDQIESIDKTKWEKKGITRIRYQENGKACSYKFDDFKFHRKNMSQILETIELKLKDEQIIGGDRETVIRERKAQEKAKREAEIAEMNAESENADS